MLLHYLVKCSTRYYCAVSNMLHAVPNEKQILLQFIDILNTQHPIDDATDSVCHRIKLGVVWCSELWYCLLQKPDSVVNTAWMSAVLQKDQELSWQLTSGTRICKLVCRIKEDILSTFSDNINNWSNVCENLT